MFREHVLQGKVYLEVEIAGSQGREDLGFNIDMFSLPVLFLITEVSPYRDAFQVHRIKYCMILF